MAMKMVVLLIIALLALIINPTFSSNNSGTDPPANGIGGWFRCPQILKQEMVERVVEHVNASATVKTVLQKSAVFVDCVAGKFCPCFKLRLEPLIYGCFGAVGGFCMKRALVGHLNDCTLGCVNNMITNNHLRLDNEAIGDICYGKCSKNV